MKIKFVGVIIVLVIICIFAFSAVVHFTSSNYLLAIFICLILASVGSYIIFDILMKPLEKMKDKLADITAENNRVEQIRSEFVANVTHELKTPLTSISGFIETLQDGAADDPEIRAKFIDIIAIETSRLKRLIEDLLVLSEIENKKEYMSSSINVSIALKDIVESISPIAGDKNIQVIINAEENCVIKGSEDRFRQMMVNLIENAIKYSNENTKVTIEINTSEDKVIVSVKDEGIGIDKEHFDRLFERFYRVDKSRSQKAGGTGLGLSIVKHIANLFDAELSVKSEIGVGSEFFVKFNKLQ